MSSTQAHYERLASSYDELWTYSRQFVASMADAIIATLELKATDRFVDLGCGSGIYAKAIADRVPFEAPLLGVDPVGSARSAGRASGCARARKERRGVLSISPGSQLRSRRRSRCRRQANCLSGLGQRLIAGGRILVALLPPTIGIPLVQEALARTYEARQPHYDEIAAMMRASGLSVDVRWFDFPVSIERGRYLDMVRRRYISLLSAFDDARLQTGLEEIAAQHPEPVLRFVDRFVFVCGSKHP